MAALVPVASGGLGWAIAETLAGAGAAVGLNGTSPAKLEEVRQAVEAAGGRAAVLPGRLEDIESCRSLVERARETLGRLDILVNCAGINRRAALDAVTPGDFDAVLSLNLRSVFFTSQAAHPHLREAGGGKIVNIGSMASHLGLARIGVYGMSKAALAQLTKTMAVEWARDGIQVNCLCPGFFRTPLTREYFWGTPHRKEWLLERIPARRAGEPVDLAGAILLLVSPSSSYITGQVISVDGGFLAGGSWDRDED
jgi:2-deoxy-D-gluconate 3-dehydrogenase